MNDASLALEKNESISIHDYDLGRSVFVYKDDEGKLGVSISDGTRDLIQVETRERLVSIKTMTGEPLADLIQANVKERLSDSICSPFDLLMEQIDAMRERAEKYRDWSKDEGNHEEDCLQNAVASALKELERLGKVFQDNVKIKEQI